MSKHTLIAVLVASLVPQHAVAEDTAPVSAGALVRVTAPTLAKAPLIGTLVESSATDLTIVLPDFGKSTIPRGAITRLEWSSGRHSRVGKGALWGAVVGVGLGYLAVGSLEDCETGCLVGGVASVAAMTAGFGALIGLAFKTYGWKETPLSHVQVSLQPVRGGARAAVAVTW